MSDIPYPHTAHVYRITPVSENGDPAVLDGWGNPVNPADPEPLVNEDTQEPLILPCWVQELGLRQRAEAATLAEDGDEGATHTVFCDPFDFQSTDFLVTLAGGGQAGDERHRIIHITNPDGGTDHLELDTLLVRRGTSV